MLNRIKYLLVISMFWNLGFNSNLLAQDVSIIKFSELENLLHPNSDTVTLINFWATWCKPCVEELPEFIELEEQFKNEKIKFYYVSLDFKKNLKNLVIPFAEKQMSNKSVFVLDETDYNSWIDKVDPSWQGSIPATIIINQHGNKFFKEGQLNKEELINALKQFKLQ